MVYFDVCIVFVVHGMRLLFIGVTGGLALPSDEARLAETPLESPGLLSSLRRRRSRNRRYMGIHITTTVGNFDDHGVQSG